MAYTIHSPAKGFTGITEFGGGPIAFNDGEATVDVLHSGVRTYMESRGYTVEEHADGPFDPSAHSVKEVRAYIDGLDDSDPDERDAEFTRVVEAERNGKARKSLLESIEGTAEEPEQPESGGEYDASGSENDH